MTSKILQGSEAGQRTAYQSLGAGEPLVLIHGVGMQSAAWGPQIEALARDYHVIALDMPGHGQSDPLPALSTLEAYVAWCHSAICALNLGPVNLAGHSMGALIAAGYTITHPDMVRRVALLSGVYRRDQASRAAVVARAAMISKGEVDLRTPLSRWFGKAASEQAIRAQVAKWLGRVDVAGYATAYSAFAQGDATYADRFNQIACPFLALTGSDDPNSTPEMSKTMADVVQHGHAIVIKGHKHMLNLTAADEVTAHLDQWLKRPQT